MKLGAYSTLSGNGKQHKTYLQDHTKNGKTTCDVQDGGSTYERGKRKGDGSGGNKDVALDVCRDKGGQNQKHQDQMNSEGGRGLTEDTRGKTKMVRAHYEE